MKVTVVPQSQRQLQDWQERLKEAGAQFQLTTKGKQVAIELEQIDAEQVLGLTFKKKMPVWKKAFIVSGSFWVLAIMMGIIAQLNSSTQADSYGSAQEGMIIDVKEAIGADPGYFESKYGVPAAEVQKQGAYPCEDFACRRITYPGNITVYFRDGRAFYISLDSSFTEIKPELARLVKLQSVAPESSNENSIFWGNYDSIEVNINFAGITAKKLTDEQLAAHEKKQLEKVRQKKISEQFSGWDGSHVNLARAVKNAMNDPKSFKHVETMFADKGDYILVYMKFRGSNAFGATVLNEITAKVDVDGNILEVIE